MPVRDIIVVGTSMGGIEALEQLAAGFPPDLPAAVVTSSPAATRREL